MKPKLYFRIAKKADIEAIMKIETARFRLDAFSRRQMLYLMNSNTSYFIVALTNDEIVGYLILLSKKGSKQIRLYAIAVSATAEGKGIGQALLDQADTYAKRKNAHRLKLEVRCDNARAIRLYEKNGFLKQRIYQAFYKDGTNAFVMVKKTDAFDVL